MRTTIDINDATLKELRQRAESSGASFREMVETVLKLGLAQLSRPSKNRRVRLKTHALGLKAGFQGQSLNQMYDQMEAEQDAHPS